MSLGPRSRIFGGSRSEKNEATVLNVCQFKLKTQCFLSMDHMCLDCVFFNASVRIASARNASAHSGTCQLAERVTQVCCGTRHRGRALNRYPSSLYLRQLTQEVLTVVVGQRAHALQIKYRCTTTYTFLKSCAEILFYAANFLLRIILFIAANGFVCAPQSVLRISFSKGGHLGWTQLFGGGVTGVRAQSFWGDGQTHCEKVRCNDT